ncbi:DNA polymerase, partial [Candidatus Pacearchaeota archaeon]
MFIEKYRPQNIDDIILEDSIKSVIKNYLATNDMPNLLLYSPSPGTGKTSLSKIIVSSLQSEFIEINASNARG